MYSLSHTFVGRIMLLCEGQHQNQDDNIRYLRSCRTEEQVTGWGTLNPHHNSNLHHTIALYGRTAGGPVPGAVLPQEEGSPCQPSLVEPCNHDQHHAWF